jgi:hypothetical protein
MRNAAMAAQTSLGILVRGDWTREKSVVLGFQDSGRNRLVTMVKGDNWAWIVARRMACD